MYKTTQFNRETVPTAPDYSKSESWAALPGKYPPKLTELEAAHTVKPVDVFYVYPTLFSNKKDSRWNADIFEASTRQDVEDRAIAFQASAWVNAGNVYAPFYRQAHYRIFVDPYKNQGKEAGELAYADVREAFLYYLAHYNHGKPIIMASHSQGTLHVKRLLKEFFDNQPLQKQLVAAYLVGTKIMNEEYQTIPPMISPTATGGFVSWNTYKQKNYPKNYENWPKGGVATNPISWNLEQQTPSSKHLGVLNKDGRIYPKSVSVSVIDGMIWASVPKIPNRFFLSLVKNYHFADINLFWADIRVNAEQRVNAFLQKSKQQ